MTIEPSIFIAEIFIFEDKDLSFDVMNNFKIDSFCAYIFTNINAKLNNEIVVMQRISFFSGFNAHVGQGREEVVEYVNILPSKCIADT